MLQTSLPVYVLWYFPPEYHRSSVRNADLARSHIDVILTGKIVLATDKSEAIRHNLKNTMCTDSTVQFFKRFFFFRLCGFFFFISTIFFGFYFFSDLLFPNVLPLWGLQHLSAAELLCPLPCPFHQLQALLLPVRPFSWLKYHAVLFAFATAFKSTSAKDSYFSLIFSSKYL